MDVVGRYPPVDKELAEGSAPNILEFLREFYNAYDRIRPNVKADAYVVFHDAFQLHARKDFVTQPRFRNVMLDTHQYLMMAEMNGCKQALNGYIEYIQEHFAAEIAKVREYVPIVCGEWCLSNSYTVGVDTKGGQTVLNGMDFTDKRSVTYMGAIENARKHLSLRTLVNIADALKTTPDFLLNGTLQHDTSQSRNEMCKFFQNCSPDERYIIIALAKCLRTSLQETNLLHEKIES